MRSVIAAVIVFCLISTVCLTAPAVAGQPHDRTGFFIGFGLGAGSAGWEDSDERAGGGVGNFRIGYAVSPNMTVGLESSSWVKREDAGLLGDLTLVYNVSTFGLTFYPGNNGVFLKGGIGFSTVSFEDVLGPIKVEDNDSGLGLLGAFGYEWRLTPKFAMGPEVELVYLKVGDPFKAANYISATWMLNWYW